MSQERVKRTGNRSHPCSKQQKCFVNVTHIETNHAYLKYCKVSGDLVLLVLVFLIIKIGKVEKKKVFVNAGSPTKFSEHPFS